MNLANILEIENKRTEQDLFKIHLFFDKDWWRAYEWSAYLCQHFPNKLSEKDKLKVTHRRKDDIVMVGFKLTSFNKYFPSVDTPNIHDGHIELDISEYMQFEECDTDNYLDMLVEWKSQIPCIEDNPKTKSINQNIEQITPFNIPTKISLTSVMQEILAYPLENKTLTDNILFIRYLKNNLLKLI